MNIYLIITTKPQAKCRAREKGFFLGCRKIHSSCVIVIVAAVLVCLFFVHIAFALHLARIYFLHLDPICPALCCSRERIPPLFFINCIASWNCMFLQTRFLFFLLSVYLDPLPHFPDTLKLASVYIPTSSSITIYFVDISKQQFPYKYSRIRLVLESQYDPAVFSCCICKLSSACVLAS